MQKFLLLSLLSSLISINAASQKADNAELQKMYDDDQRARQTAQINWEIVNQEDFVRRTRVREMISRNELNTGRDHYNAAMIFQHGGDTIASSLAVKHMKRAIELDPKTNKWLLAAAIDRDLMRRGKPQIYGTQYSKGFNDTKFKRYLLDSTQVTDEERRQYGVETLAEQRVKLHSMNLKPIAEFDTKSLDIQKATELIRSEFKKGSKGEYDVSESGINQLGYQLLRDQRPDAALIIFQLNTELYPKGWNTFDSLGECLFLMNRKAEGIEAYKKSLALNPQNENARKIIDGNR